MKDEKLLYLWSSRKNPSGGGFTKNQYIGGDCLKRGGLDSFQMGGGTRGGALQERGGGVFEGAVDTPMHNIVLYCVLLDPRQ